MLHYPNAYFKSQANNVEGDHHNPVRLQFIRSQSLQCLFVTIKTPTYRYIRSCERHFNNQSSFYDIAARYITLSSYIKLIFIRSTFKNCYISIDINLHFGSFSREGHDIDTSNLTLFQCRQTLSAKQPSQ